LVVRTKYIYKGISILLIKMIRKLPNKRLWRVYSESGRNMGTFKTKHLAHKRLGQVEAFKRRTKKR